jgi:hypothetical protein
MPGMQGSIASVIGAVRAGVTPRIWGIAAFALWGVGRTRQSCMASLLHPSHPAWMEWHLVVAMSLVMLPILLPPLAVAWNRRRQQADRRTMPRWGAE